MDGTKDKQGSLLSLQFGRGVAALAVLAFHLSIMMGDQRYGGITTFSEFTWRGNLGVDFFFVLSGFIILHAHARDIGRPGRWGHYMFRRIARLYPTYWIYTGGLIALLAIGLGSVAKPPENALAWLADITLLPFSPAEPTIPPAWTLFHEVIFYLLFSLLILNRWLGLVVIAIWGASCAMLYQYPSIRSPLLIFTAAYNLNFLLGMAAFLAYRHGVLKLSAASIAATIVVVALIVESRGVAVSPLIYAGAFAAVIAGLATVERQRPLNIPRAFRMLGDASYSIYLTHESVASLLLKIANSLRLPELVSREILYVAVFVCTTAAGVVAYLIIERPVLRMVRSWEPKGPGQPALAPVA